LFTETERALISKRVSASLVGKTGERARRWLGDKAGYSAMHMWIRQEYGKASKCEKCGTTQGKYEWANISGEYRRSREDYMELCPSCHHRMDWGNFCSKGHEYTPQNTLWSKDGRHRFCRECSRMRNKLFRQKKAQFRGRLEDGKKPQSAVKGQ
jgi:hypothetical protein